MKSSIFILVSSVVLLSGCAEAMHRYGPDPFGEKSTYNVVYTDENPESVYLCIQRKVAAGGNRLEVGVVPQNDFESYFVYNGRTQIARYTFDTRGSSSTGTQIYVQTPGNARSHQFIEILNKCSKGV